MRFHYLEIVFLVHDKYDDVHEYNFRIPDLLICNLYI